MAIQLEQRMDLRKIGPTKWRLILLVGQGIVFYAETGAEQPPFSVNNELGAGDVGNWRGIDGRRRLVIGHGGKANVAVKPDGKPGEYQATFEGLSLAV